MRTSALRRGRKTASAWLRAVGAACSAVLLAGTVACTGPSDRLQVEGTASPGSVELAPTSTEPEAQWGKPFSTAEIVKALLAADLSALPTVPASLEQAPTLAPSGGGAARPTPPVVQPPTTGELRVMLKHCNGYCLQLSAPASVEGERLQLVSLTSIADGWGYASFAVADVGGKPKIKLMVEGENISLAAGRGDTLVAQEYVYLPDEPLCCPSGWSLRMFRWDGERFVGGQRIQGSTHTQSGEDP